MKIEDIELLDLYHLLKSSYLAEISHETTTSLITNQFKQPDKQEQILKLFLDESTQEWSLKKFTEEIYNVLFPSIFDDTIKKYRDRIESLRNANFSQPSFMDRARDEIKIIEEFIEDLQNIADKINIKKEKTDDIYPEDPYYLVAIEQQDSSFKNKIIACQDPVDYLIEKWERSLNNTSIVFSLKLTVKQVAKLMEYEKSKTVR